MLARLSSGLGSSKLNISLSSQNQNVSLISRSMSAASSSVVSEPKPASSLNYLRFRKQQVATIEYILAHSNTRMIYSGWNLDSLLKESQLLGAAACTDYHLSWNWWKSRIYLRILASFEKDVDEDSVRGRTKDPNDSIFSDHLGLLVGRTTVTSHRDARIFGGYAFHMNFIRPKLLIYASTDSNFEILSPWQLTNHLLLGEAKPPSL